MSRANPRTTHDNAGIAAWKFNLAAEVRSYEQAEKFLDGEHARLLGPKMVVHWSSDIREGYLAVRLYDTEIIRYYADGTFSVDNGGFNTPTTTRRLDAVLPEGYRAYHHRKQLGLWGKGHGHGGDLWPLDHSTRIPV